MPTEGEQPAQVDAVVLEVGDLEAEDKKAQLKSKSQSSSCYPLFMNCFSKRVSLD